MLILDGAVIGDNCIIGAGSLVPQNKIIPENSLGFGNPFIIKREVTEKEKEHILWNANEYVKEANEYKKESYVICLAFLLFLIIDYILLLFQFY